MINQLYYDDFCKRCPIKHGNMVLFDGICISFLLLRARSLYSSHVVHVLCGAIFWPLDVSCWILIQGVPKKHGNTVTNSISSLLWISIVIPNYKSHNIIMSARVYLMKTVKDCKDVSIMSPQDEQWIRTSLLCLYTGIFLFY